MNINRLDVINEKQGVGDKYELELPKDDEDMERIEAARTKKFVQLKIDNVSMFS